MSSFVGSGLMSGPLPSALLSEAERKEKRKREKFYIYLDVTHTHTHPSGAATLKGKRKKKADTNDRQTAKTAQGGKGTDGPPEPTYTAKHITEKPHGEAN